MRMITQNENEKENDNISTDRMSDNLVILKTNLKNQRTNNEIYFSFSRRANKLTYFSGLQVSIQVPCMTSTMAWSWNEFLKKHKNVKTSKT